MSYHCQDDDPLPGWGVLAVVVVLFLLLAGQANGQGGDTLPGYTGTDIDISPAGTWTTPVADIPYIFFVTWDQMTTKEVSDSKTRHTTYVTWAVPTHELIVGYPKARAFAGDLKAAGGCDNIRIWRLGPEVAQSE